jgi:hypothetical protein
VCRPMVVGRARVGRAVSGGSGGRRRNYARAVVRSLSRQHHGQPVAQVQQQLRSALTPRGVRLSPVALRELAAGISAGTPVELP